MKANRKGIAVSLTATARSVLRVALLVAAGCVLSACRPTPEAASTGDVAGVYALVSVNGNKVPATVAHDKVNLQIRSGAFTINSDGTCSSKMVFVPPTGVEATREVTATYTREGAKLNMQWKGAGTTVGTVDGDTFTMNNEGMVLAYKK